MEVLVCVKRVPAPGARIVLSDDRRAIETKHLGFTVSPHEECAVEEAVRLVERHGGHVTVLTMGPPEAEQQLRDAVAMGADAGVLVDVGTTEADPQATAAALVEAIRTLQDEGAAFDLVLFGDESADAGNSQVSIRVAHALGLPIVAGVKGLDFDTAGGVAGLRRDTEDGVERYEVAPPLAAAVKEGINLPRYPALKGRMRARKATMRRVPVALTAGGLEFVRLHQPLAAEAETEILGHGSEAAPAVVDLLERQGVLR